MRGERMKGERERGEGVEEESEGSIPTSFQKRLGCESEKFESDLVRLLYLPFSYFTTPAVPHMRCRKNSLSEKVSYSTMTSTAIQPQQYIVQFYSK